MEQMAESGQRACWKSRLGKQAGKAGWESRLVKQAGKAGWLRRLGKQAGLVSTAHGRAYVMTYNLLKNSNGGIKRQRERCR